MPERTPIDLGDVLNEIAVPEIGCALDDFHPKEKKNEDIFAEHKRKEWDKTIEARCDFARRVRLTRRGGVWFLTLWQKSIMGRTLTDIKSDTTMIDFFANEISDLIGQVIGNHLSQADWCIITTPKRRHTVRNFATAISIEISKKLDIPFYEDVCSCHTRQRINAEFTVNMIPPENNIICFDDFVTTGSTLCSMSKAFETLNKNMIFVAGINNKL